MQIRERERERANGLIQNDYKNRITQDELKPPSTPARTHSCCIVLPIIYPLRNMNYSLYFSYVGIFNKNM